MFCRTVRSGANPIPSSSIDTTRPCTVIRPAVGLRTGPRIFSSVLLPPPLRPMMPTISPGATSKRTSPLCRAVFPSMHVQGDRIARFQQVQAVAAVGVHVHGEHVGTAREDLQRNADHAGKSARLGELEMAGGKAAEHDLLLTLERH